jgi:hypothetical protein
MSGQRIFRIGINSVSAIGWDHLCLSRAFEEDHHRKNPVADIPSPEVGNHPRLTEKINTETIAIQKSGALAPNNEK